MMEFFALPDEYVKKISFVADCYERDQGFRPPDIQFICAAISFMYDGVAESIGFGVPDGGDE